MTTRRDAILNGAARAAEIHSDLGLREDLRDGYRPVDILAAIHDLDLLVLFRPLQSLLGAYLPSLGAAPGILLTTQRTLHIQRFTAAHELGHHVLGHRAMSLDKDVGFVARGEHLGHDMQELEADAFASAFMLPDWLLVAHARRHGWGKKDLLVPDTVYQLSLRMGASYTATCWSLVQANLITDGDARLLASKPPKDSKQRAIPDIKLSSWHPDVWKLSERDRGVEVLGNPDDMLVFALEENIAGGYAWDASTVEAVGLTIEKDERRETEAEIMGGPITRRLVAQGRAKGHLRLEEKRNWDDEGSSLNTFEVDLSMLGPETAGLPRVAR